MNYSLQHTMGYYLTSVFDAIDGILLNRLEEVWVQSEILRIHYNSYVLTHFRYRITQDPI